MNRLNILLH